MDLQACLFFAFGVCLHISICWYMEGLFRLDQEQWTRFFQRRRARAPSLRIQRLINGNAGIGSVGRQFDFR